MAMMKVRNIRLPAFFEQLGVTPVILQEQINRDMTVIEKFEKLHLALVLLLFL